MTPNQTDRYPYVLPPLPYAYDALEPYIDEETMHYHHDKHFATYIANLNKALEPYPALQALTLEQLLARPSLPPAAKETILNNGGGVYNHRFFFEHLTPPAEGKTSQNTAPAERINKTFGSWEQFKKEFTETAMGVFGSGWACLALTRANELKIIPLANQETPVAKRARPLLLFDVWEHAYYLKYKNARADYVDALWNVAEFGA